MNRYSIRYHSRTLAALAGRAKQQTLPLPAWAFNYPKLPNYELKIALSDHVKKTDNINLHTGLNITAHMKADSEEEARDISKNYVETLLNLISFSTLTYCDAAILVSIISITDKETHPFSYYIYPFSEQEMIGQLSVIDEPTFGTVFDAYDKSSYKLRTLRALTWLRKGIGEENVVDQFICYWTGWEVIMGILRRKSRYQIRNPGKWDGLKVILTNKLSFQNFDAIKDARRKLFHGGKEEDKLDDDFIREIKTYLEPMRKALVFGIGSIWGLENNIISTIANKIPRRVEQPSWAVMKGNINNLPKDFNELARNYPTLNAETVNKQFSINQEGNLGIKFDLTHKFRGPSATKWNLREIELWGKKDTGIQQLTLDKVRVDKAKKLS